MTKVFVFLTFFIIAALSHLSPENIYDLKSQESASHHRYCEKKIRKGAAP